MPTGKRLSRIAAAVVITAAVVLGIAYLFSQKGYIVLSDYETGETLVKFEASPRDKFSVEFIHSVNKTPVRDIFVICGDGRIQNISCVYYDFGAGVQTQLNEGETFRYEDGAMVIEGIEIYYEELIYAMLTSSTHVLRIGDEALFLPSLSEGDFKLLISYKRSLF